MKDLINNLEHCWHNLLDHRSANHSVVVWVAIGYECVSKRNNIDLYLISDTGARYKVSKRFYGRRTARVYGKTNYKNMLINDINFTPVKPLEYITLNFTINNENGKWKLNG